MVNNSTNINNMNIVVVINEPSLVTLVNMNTLLIQSEMYHAFYFNVIYI
jgi:hypothetical protein